MDELTQLLGMLGVTSFAEATTAIANMNAALEQAQAALGTKGTVATMSALVARSARLSALEKAAGKEGEEADGLLRAALVSHAELPKVQSRVAELEKVEQTSKLAALFADAEKAGKLTPAIKQSVQASFDAGEITLKGAESWLSNLVPVAALANQGANAPKPAAPTASGGAPLMHEGKTYDQLAPLERVALKKSNPELFNAMRASAQG